MILNLHQLNELIIMIDASILILFKKKEFDIRQQPDRARYVKHHQWPIFTFESMTNDEPINVFRYKNSDDDNDDDCDSKR